MYSIFLFALLIPVCFAKNVPIQAPVLCGVVPENTYQCLKDPPKFWAPPGKKCDRLNTQCEKLTCAFTQYGWLKNNRVLKEKIASHIARLTAAHPAWAGPLAAVKTECVDRDLPPQGVILNCAPYDIAQCVLEQFVKSTPESQWEADIDCRAPRQFAAACPLCPEDCFAPAIPAGSCNACRRLPATAP